MKIDPSNTWKAVEERLAVETDPRLRRNLETILRHMQAEARLDIDGLLETLSAQPHYHAYTPAGEIPELCPKGRDAVRKFYEDFVASGAYRLELAVERLVVDRDCVLTEGVMRMAYPGATLQAMGHAVDDPEAFYLFEDRMAILWPMDEDGQICGEDTYSVGRGFEGIADRKLAPEDIAPL
jgi:hypothetical protein